MQLSPGESVRTQKSLKNGIAQIPRHVAIIPDGNRRWANARGLPPLAGHWKGASILEGILNEAANLGVKIVTLYSFSTENWNRSADEVSGLMQLFENYLIKIKDQMVESGMKLASIGDLSPFPDGIKKALAAAKKATESCTGMTLVLALNYGGRDDLRRAVLSVMEDYKRGVILKENFTEAVLGSYLDTAEFGDPELLIRTGGEKRVSNFLLWQLYYSEVLISDIYWPDFTAKDFRKAIDEFQNRERRLGE